MSEEKAPGSGAFFPASLMYFCSGKPMHLCSGVDSLPRVERESNIGCNRHWINCSAQISHQHGSTQSF
jgi:hypothetical protein